MQDCLQTFNALSTENNRSDALWASEYDHKTKRNAHTHTHTHTHTPRLVAEEREHWAAVSSTTKGSRRVDVCADTGECVDICDTLSQQMYVISFRRVEQGGGSDREKKRERMKESFRI